MKCLYLMLLRLTLFSTFNKNDRVLSFVINGKAVPHIESVKFQGCYLDAQLNWRACVDRVCCRVSCGLAMIKT